MAYKEFVEGVINADAVLSYLRELQERHEIKFTHYEIVASQETIKWLAEMEKEEPRPLPMLDAWMSREYPSNRSIPKTAWKIDDTVPLNKAYVRFVQEIDLEATIAADA